MLNRHEGEAFMERPVGTGGHGALSAVLHRGACRLQWVHRRERARTSDSRPGPIGIPYAA